MPAERVVLVPPERLTRWFDNFGSRHGDFTLETVDGRLRASAEDGARAIAELPFARPYDGPADAADLASAAAAPIRWGILLVRKGGFAVAALDGSTVLASKVGQRHVQGRTKAGGQSQQRFARRRDNQARQAYEAAAGHAHRVLVQETGGLGALVCGGDRGAVDTVLADRQLAGVAELRTDLFLTVPDPRRDVLDQAIRDASSVQITLT